MATIELNESNLETTVNNNEIVVVDFWAPWCGPCKSFAPVYEAVSEKYPDIIFGKINTEDEQAVAAHFQIRSIPTLMVFREQIIVYAEAGMLPEPALADMIERVRTLDMEKLKAENEGAGAEDKTKN